MYIVNDQQLDDDVCIDQMILIILKYWTSVKLSRVFVYHYNDQQLNDDVYIDQKNSKYTEILDTCQTTKSVYIINDHELE